MKKAEQIMTHEQIMTRRSTLSRNIERHKEDIIDAIAAFMREDDISSRIDILCDTMYYQALEPVDESIDSQFCNSPERITGIVSHTLSVVKLLTKLADNFKVIKDYKKELELLQTLGYELKPIEEKLEELQKQDEGA
jgi:hypothetical protein